MRRLAMLILATMLITGCTVNGQDIDTSEMDPIPVVVVTPDDGATMAPESASTATIAPDPEVDPNLVIGVWYAAYYANHEQLQAPVFALSESSIDHNWELDSPDDELLPVDGFSVEWTGAYEFVEGYYRIEVRGTMRVEVYRSGELVMVHTALSGETRQRLAFADGVYLLDVRAYDRPGNARVQVSWELVGSLDDATPVSAPTATAAP